MKKVSIVVTSRNDNHGGNLLQRMQIFVNGLLAQCQRHNLDAELVLVEWNPPADKPRFAEALSWPTKSSPCNVRIIEVSPEIHRRYQYSEQLPLFQIIAKNAGIRRVYGQFVLATNIDILFSDAMMRFLASSRLRKGIMYRVDRLDVPAEVPTDASIEAQLAYCQQHVMRVYARDGIQDMRTGAYYEGYPKLTWQGWMREKMQDLGGMRVINRSRLHTRACGDFTLMQSEHWFDLRGYAEFEMYSLHIDSLLCYAAYHHSIRERVLLMPKSIYHIEHAIGSGWVPEGEQQLTDRLKRSGIPQISYEQFDAWAVRMRKEQKPIIFNKDIWGLNGEDLPEIRIS